MRRYFIPEVIQTSLMDCGPAALQSLFAGFGIALSYGRLRELSHTDVDGTSIDVLEELAGALGLEVEQRMLPPDLLLLPSARALPALVVLRQPDGGAHFVVLWRVHGPLVQIMDPGVGRRWLPRQRLLDSLYLHEQGVERSDWLEWAQSEEFVASLRERSVRLRVKHRRWSDPALQDAALRLAGTLRAAGQLRPGADAERLLALCEQHPEHLPERFWTLRSDPEQPQRARLCGAVLVSVRGLSPAPEEPLPPELAAVRNEPPPRVWAVLGASAREAGWALPLAIALGTALFAFGTVLEAALLRWLLDPGRHLQLGAQRLGAGLALLVSLLSLLGLRWPAKFGLLRLGAQLEQRLRLRFALRVPRLGDRYFQSRLVSEMAFRAHWVQLLAQLPELAGELLRVVLGLVITALAIVWLYPGSGLWVLLAALAACLPLALAPVLVERELRVRELSTALGRFYLDVLLASRPIQAHAAGAALQTAYASQLERWASAGLRQQLALASADVLGWGLSLAPVVALLWGAARSLGNPADLLLLTYWASAIPVYGSQLASLGASWPSLRNTLLQLLEPLSAPQEPVGAPLAVAPHAPTAGVSVEFQQVSVACGGSLVLADVSLRVEPGEHVAIVGSSGAGKSSLLGLLLGWHVPAKGSVRIDGERLDPARLAQLRQQTAWIDPQVHLFRSSLFANLRYGNEGRPLGLGAALQDAQLGGVLERLPLGLQTELGEGGALVSGGEGQRVRIARALARTGTRLALLDEPTRGLDRDSRQHFLARARQHFERATLFHITHHIADTLAFDRVLVVQAGRIVEQGAPARLRQVPSHYRELLEQEEQLQRELWSAPWWQRLRLEHGRVDRPEQVPE